MVISPIGSRDAGGPDGAEPLRERLVPLSVPRAPSESVGKAKTSRQDTDGRLYRIGLQFTPADRASLAAWIDESGHGYDRVEIERGSLEDGSWTDYALIYRLVQAWATWGVVRRGNHLEVWRCATGKTVGRHPRMALALASLPHAIDHQRELEVPMAEEVAECRYLV